MLKVCVISVFTSTKTSGRGTNRVLVFPISQAEVISITADSWVRTGAEFYCLVEDVGCALSRLAVLSGAQAAI